MGIASWMLNYAIKSENGALWLTLQPAARSHREATILEQLLILKQFFSTHIFNLPYSFVSVKVGTSEHDGS